MYSIWNEILVQNISIMTMDCIWDLNVNCKEFFQNDLEINLMTLTPCLGR